MSKSSAIFLSSFGSNILVNLLLVPTDVCDMQMRFGFHEIAEILRMKLIYVGVVFLSTLAAQGYEVVCEDIKTCSPSVAGILVKNEQSESGVSTCTSFLVANDLAATNLHCLPKDLREKGRSCSGKIRFFFPKTEHFDPVQADCETVLSVSPPVNDGELNKDYAFVRLTRPVPRPFLLLTQTGVADGKAMTIYKVDPDPVRATMKQVNCRAIQNSVLNPFFVSDTSPLVLLGPCESVIKGNSGSPILDANGTARGIVSSILLPKPSVLASSSEDKRGGMNAAGSGANQGASISGGKSIESSAGHSTEKMVVGTNFSCLDLTFMGRSSASSESCRIEVNKKTELALVNARLEEAQKKHNQLLQKKVELARERLFKASDKIFDWQVDLDGEMVEKGRSAQQVLKLSPKCWLNKPRFENVLVSTLKGRRQRYHLKVPQFHVRHWLDESFRIQSEVKEVMEDFDIEFRPFDFVSKNRIPISVLRAEVFDTDESSSEQPRLAENGSALREPASVSLDREPAAVRSEMAECADSP